MQKGFSLIELLCALAIGIIIITVIVEVFVDYKQIHLIENALAETQENARFAAHIMRRSIEHADLIGCGRLTGTFAIHDNGVKSINEIAYNKNFKVYQGNSGSWTPILPAEFSINPKSDTDVILVRYINPITAKIIEPLDDNEIFYVGLNPKFNKNNDIAISDCTKIVLVRVKATYSSMARNYQRITATQNINNIFNIGAEVGRIETRLFFIKATSRKNKLGQKIYALYQKDATGRSSELISNVISMKVLCYVQTSSQALQEKPPNQVVDWSQVKAVKIELLLVSSNKVLRQAKPHYFCGKKYITQDLRMYKTLQFFVPLQERVEGR